MTMHPVTDQCLFASRVLPPGVSLRTGLLVAIWLLTTDHHSGWSLPWPLCRLICRWSPGHWPPITALGDRLPGLSVTWSTCHPASGPRGSLLLTSSTTDDRSDQFLFMVMIMGRTSSWKCVRMTFSIDWFRGPSLLHFNSLYSFLQLSYSFIIEINGSFCLF